MGLNLTNGTDTQAPHDTGYDETLALWIAMLGVFLIVGVFAVPWLIDPEWYPSYGGQSPYATVVPEKGNTTAGSKVVPMGLPVETAPVQPIDPPPAYSRMIVRVFASPGGIVIPNTSVSNSE